MFKLSFNLFLAFIYYDVSNFLSEPKKDTLALNSRGNVSLCCHLGTLEARCWLRPLIGHALASERVDGPTEALVLAGGSKHRAKSTT